MTVADASANLPVCNRRAAASLKTIHFHVGSGRCGSTLIQSLFNDPGMHKVFDLYSIRYDPNIYLASTELTPCRKFIESEWRDFRETHVAPLKKQKFDSFFLTQENLFGVRWDKGSSNSCDESCKIVSYVTKGFDARIVILVRRQDTYIESLYNQLIKRGELRDFPTFLKEMPLDNLDWAAVADVYAGHFGRQNVTVLPFERKVLNTGGTDDFINAVLAAIGVTRKLKVEGLPTVNPSLAPRVIEVQRLANRLLPEIESHSLANWFEQNIPKSPDDPHTLMSAKDRKRLLKTFAASNRRLFEEYMEPYDPADYLG